MRHFKILVVLLLIFNSACFSQQTSVHKAISLVIFLDTNCPISQKYIGLINDIASKYNPKVSVTGIIPGKITTRDLHDFKRLYNVHFKIIQDKQYKNVSKFKATITPEAFLLSSGKVAYQGAIDNWFYDLGKNRNVATENYLIDAIESLIINATPKITRTEAVGCIIQKI